MPRKGLIVIVFVFLITCGQIYGQTIKIGLNYPQTGPYSVQGLAQVRAADMAAEEINARGGIMNRPIELVKMDSQSKPYTSQGNVEEMISKHNCEMIFGGSASSVAIAAGKVAQSKGKLFFGTLTYSNATTGKEGHKFIFRECYNAWMGAKVLGSYLKTNYPDKNYYYITADYTWGWTTEDSIRQFTGTTNKRNHRRTFTPFPGATEEDFTQALQKAQAANPDVLVLVLFGKDMSTALKIATTMGIKRRMAVVVPNLTLGMAEGAGPEVMEGVVGALPWCWKVPFIYNYENGKNFVKKFSDRYQSYPSTSAASAYTILYEYKNAVERVNSFNARVVIGTLEGHRYVSLKDEQYWRDFDHQSVQTVYAVKCKPVNEVMQDKYNQDYFEIINEMPGDEAAMTREEWAESRRLAGKPPVLEW